MDTVPQVTPRQPSSNFKDSGFLVLTGSVGTGYQSSYIENYKSDAKAAAARIVNGTFGSTEVIVVEVIARSKAKTTYELVDA